jgi:hypothetical protein
MKQLLLDGLLLRRPPQLRQSPLRLLDVSGTATNDGLNPRRVRRPRWPWPSPSAPPTAATPSTSWPGHAETISAATAISPAGVNIIGLGAGTARPTITLGTANTAASIVVSAANVSFENIIFVANFLSIAACFTLSAAEFQVRNCLFKDTSSVLNFLTIIGIGAGANTADGLVFNDNVVNNLGVTSNNTTINSGSTIDRLQALRNNLKWAVQNDKPILIDVTTGILTNADIGFNKGYRPNTTTAGGSLIKLTGTTSTGWVYNNYVQTLTTTTDLLFTTSVGPKRVREPRLWRGWCDRICNSCG